MKSKVKSYILKTILRSLNGAKRTEFAQAESAQLLKILADILFVDVLLELVWSIFKRE